MARIRSLKPDLLSDEKTAALASDTWRLYVSMILMADDYGNLRAAPGFVSGTAFWAMGSPPDVAKGLRDLSAAGLIELYAVNGQGYAHLSGWSKHQRVDHPGKPLVPGPEEGTTAALETSSRDIRDTLSTDRERERDRSEPPALPSESFALALAESGSDRVGRSASKEPSLFDRALEWFCIAWEAQYEETYVPTPADRSQLGRMLQKFPMALVGALPIAFANYCSGADRFEGEAHRHSLKFFCTSGGFNKYRTTARTSGFSEKELRGRAAGAEWVAEMNGRGR